MKKSSPAKGKYLNTMLGIAKVYAGMDRKDPGTKIKKVDAMSEDYQSTISQAGRDYLNGVTTTPVKSSPYKMAGMSWKDGQDPMSGKAAGKPSPNKELITSVIIGGMILGAIADGVTGAQQAKAEKKRLKTETDMFNAEGKYNADVKNRELETLAKDKKSKALEGFTDRASRKSEIYASAAANTKF